MLQAFRESYLRDIQDLKQMRMNNDSRALRIRTPLPETIQEDDREQLGTLSEVPKFGELIIGEDTVESNILLENKNFKKFKDQKSSKKINEKPELKNSSLSVSERKEKVMQSLKETLQESFAREEDLWNESKSSATEFGKNNSGSQEESHQYSSANEELNYYNTEREPIIEELSDSQALFNGATHTFAGTGTQLIDNNSSNGPTFRKKNKNQPSIVQSGVKSILEEEGLSNEYDNDSVMDKKSFEEIDKDVDSQEESYSETNYGESRDKLSISRESEDSHPEYSEDSHRESYQQSFESRESEEPNNTSFNSKSKYTKQSFKRSNKFRISSSRGSIIRHSGDSKDSRASEDFRKLEQREEKPPQALTPFLEARAPEEIVKNFDFDTSEISFLRKQSQRETAKEEENSESTGKKSGEFARRNQRIIDRFDQLFRKFDIVEKKEEEEEEEKSRESSFQKSSNRESKISQNQEGNESVYDAIHISEGSIADTERYESFPVRKSEDFYDDFYEGEELPQSENDIKFSQSGSGCYRSEDDDYVIEESLVGRRQLNSRLTETVGTVSSNIEEDEIVLSMGTKNVEQIFKNKLHMNKTSKSNRYEEEDD